MSGEHQNDTFDFDFCALQYLNIWCLYDRLFVEALASGEKPKQAQCVQEVVEYYRIARNFKKLTKEERAERILRTLRELPKQIKEYGVDSTVDKVAQELGSGSNEKLISAASKFLWIKYKSPVAIYDSRALACLRKQKKDVSGYAEFRKEWCNQFKTGDREFRIQLACEKLPTKQFASAFDIGEQKLRSSVGERWFRERVFDQFLWWSGGSEPSLLEIQMGQRSSR